MIYYFSRVLPKSIVLQMITESYEGVAIVNEGDYYYCYFEMSFYQSFDLNLGHLTLISWISVVLRCTWALADLVSLAPHFNFPWTCGVFGSHYCYLSQFMTHLNLLIDDNYQLFCFSLKFTTVDVCFWWFNVVCFAVVKASGLETKRLCLFIGRWS
jgi:hypothetical protein